MTARHGLRAAALAALVAGCGPARLDGFLYDPMPGPAGGHYTLSTDVIPGHQDVFIDSTDGVKVHVAFIPASNASPGAHPDVTMLYFHGQSNNVGSSWPRLEMLYPLGVNLAAVDPRGYGLSTGEPSERGIHDDLLAVWDQLPGKVAAVDPAKLVIYGRSLGAAFATDLAASRRTTALVTESAFASIKEMVRDGAYVDLPPGFVADSRWDNLAKIPKVAAPYLAIHGLADDYVRYQYSQMLAAAHEAASLSSAAKTQLELVPDANHGDAHGPPPTLEAVQPGSYVALLRAFLGL
jgi:pimeloyl-ACP methyl ester carboxylesterase